VGSAVAAAWVEAAVSDSGGVDAQAPDTKASIVLAAFQVDILPLCTLFARSIIDLNFIVNLVLLSKTLDRRRDDHGSGLYPRVKA
jgi:hypothetical protein